MPVSEVLILGYKSALNLVGRPDIAGYNHQGAPQVKVSGGRTTDHVWELKSTHLMKLSPSADRKFALPRQMRPKAFETWCVLFLASASTCEAERTVEGAKRISHITFIF
jgi:hypothetical protein